MITTDELRDKFLQFFAKKGHKVVPSDSLVPKDDPTVLFTSAGMNQFKPQFMGHITDFTRATSCQKCLRTDDLPQVGKTPYHHSFFEMLGNFSFGDYFKQEAILWAWEFLTKELKIDPERLWVSVHKNDQEAYEIWRDLVGIPEKKIARLGDKTNFWPSDAIRQGPNGPCGPCSEIFFDQGEEFSSYANKHNCGLDCDCGRFAEIWNLVFTQYDRQSDGKLSPLPRKNIDTGMGLERISAVMQGKHSNFEIDIFQPIVFAILDIIGKKIDQVEKSLVFSIADHIRAVTFAIADGVIPSNEARGYVVRKLIRKALWYGRSLGCRGEMLFKLVPVVCSVMKRPYPELSSREEFISQLVKSEEKRFLDTLEVGLNLISEEIEKTKKAGGTVLSGQVCFVLYDTYGFPIEMSREIARQYGLSIQEDVFNQLMEEQRLRSKSSAKTVDDIFAHRNLRKCGKGMCFVGYDCLQVETQVRGILKDDMVLSETKVNDEVDIVLEECPFYGESGGQVGDTGIIKKQDALAKVLDTYKVGDTVACKVKILQGSFKPADKVVAVVDGERRVAIARNHTATHLLQAALRKVLGEHIEQAGSLVAEDRLRFDFTHFEQINPDQLREIELLVNQWIMENLPVEKMEMSYSDAKKLGALAFFGEKYGDNVRVVKVGDVSCELCGGTHLDFTGQIGSFLIISERSISAGVRRIEAITGKAALNYVSNLRDVVNSIKSILKTDQQSLPSSVKELLKKTKEQEKQIDKLETKLAIYIARDHLKAEKLSEDIELVSGIFNMMDINALRRLWDTLKASPKKVVAVLVGIKDGKVYMILGARKELVNQGLDMREGLKVLQGVLPASGGGRADFVQVGLKCSEKELRNKWNFLIELLKTATQDRLAGGKEVNKSE